MADGLNVIIVDDDKNVCSVLYEVIKRFYTWGEVISFNDSEEALSYCLEQEFD